MNPNHDMRRQSFDESAFEKCNHARRTLDWVRRKFEGGFWIFASLLLSVTARAGEESWRIFLEPKFLHSPVTAPIPAAKRTELAAGELKDGGLEVLGKDEFSSLGLEWDKFAERAQQNAATDLASLKPRFERDARKTILYGALESDQPIVASAVLAPGFLDLWKDTLGDTLLVVVPNRSTAYVFPRLASDYQSYYPMIFRAYGETSHPVSAEVFEVSKAGWKCVGIYEEP